MGRTICRVRNMVLYQGICLHSPTWPFPDSITLGKNPPLCPSKMVPVTSTSHRCYQHQLRWCLWSANQHLELVSAQGMPAVVTVFVAIIIVIYQRVPYTWIYLFHHTFLFFPLSIKLRLASRDSIPHSCLLLLLLYSLCLWCPSDIARWGLKLYLKAIIGRAERTTHPGHRVLCRYLSREKEVLWPLLLLYCTKWVLGEERFQ